MSSDYYFDKWKINFNKLVSLVHLDLEYQDTKAHDKNWCEAVERLIGVLGMYMAIYNETLDCYRHNLQVQKTLYIAEVIKAVVARILELKEQIKKLVASDYQFMGRGLINFKLTTYDVELSDVLVNHERSRDIKMLVSEAFQRAKEREEKNQIDTTVQEIELEDKISQKANWWESDAQETGISEHKGINVTAVYELEQEEELPIEMVESRKIVILIQSHERLRKTLLQIIKQKQKLEKWKKELNGTLQPLAKPELRQKSAKMIQKILRAYFEIKRKRYRDCKRDELLNIKYCEKASPKNTEPDPVEDRTYPEKFKQFKKHWIENCENIKQKYILRKQYDIEEDTRDEIMEWFRKWYDETSFFFNIPNEREGGSVLIVKEEVLTPKEWLEKYEEYLIQKRKNKNKTSYELKWEKKEAKNELLSEKRAEHLRKKKEQDLLKKMRKNPNYNPGYNYPESKKMGHMLEAINKYENQWADLDYIEAPGVKQKFVVDVDVDNMYMDVKLEIRKTVDVEMRETLKILQNALKIDYERNNEKVPEQMKQKKKRRKKQRKHKVESTKETIADRLQDLAFRGFLKEYPKTQFEDFSGDYNFAAEDLRCALKSTHAFAGETRGLWWERCRNLTHGFHRIVLVGPKGTGKTTLVYAMASVNDAVLYEIDPASLREEFLSAIYLQQLATSMAASAKATQPSIIYIRHVHRLYYKKAPPEEDTENLNLIKIYLVRKLLKKIHKTDKITVVASCLDPWLANTKQMLKQFPNVVLLPETNYSAVSTILRNWMLNNHAVPKDLDTQSLAKALRGYPFGHIKDTLNKFLSADRIIKIAAYGLSPEEIYDFFLEDDEQKVDYDKYLNWYGTKSHWGKKAKALLEEQREFQQLLKEWQEKKKKRKKLDNTVPI